MRHDSDTRASIVQKYHVKFGAIALSPAEGIHAGFAGRQAKMAARLCAIIQADSDGRSSRPAVAGRVRHPGAKFDADMTVNPLATGSFLDRRAACGASLSRARRGLVAGLKLAG